MAATVTECGDVRIITQVIQQKNPPVTDEIRELGSPSIPSHLTSALPKNFTNALPKALGVIQIVLGATRISFGIALTVAQDDFRKLTVNSGVYFWMGVLLLISGSLLVEMEKRTLALLGKLCLLVNVLVSGAAIVAIILHATEIGKETTTDICSNISNYYCSGEGWVLVYGLNSVFIILSVLELAISLTAMAVAIKSTREQSYRQMVSR